MKNHIWSFTLQWSRFGLNAAVFLVAARFLSLSEIGVFATAFAPIKLAQVIHKAGIVEAVIIKPNTPTRLATLFGLSLGSGVLLSLSYFALAIVLGAPASTAALGLIPLLLGLSSVSEGLLRKRLRIRALALRTAASQTVAAVVALIMLKIGYGAAALVGFAVLNVALSSVVSVFLAQWWPSETASLKRISQTSKLVFQIAGRDAVNSSVLPLAQIGIGLRFGLAEAGAFQIATRMLSMLDALTLSPLRYIALPSLKRIADDEAFKQKTTDSLRHSLTLACWIWFGLAVATTDLLVIAVGPQHAIATAPMLLSLIPLGLSAAFTMPFAQALTARGQTGLVFKRAIALLACSTALSLPMFWVSAQSVALALSLASICTLAGFLYAAFRALSMTGRILTVAVPPFTAGAIMLAVLSVANLPLPAEIALGTLIYTAVLFTVSRTLKGGSPR